MVTLALAPAVPFSVRVVSLVLPPWTTLPITGRASSVTVLMTGVGGAVASITSECCARTSVPTSIVPLVTTIS